MTDTELLDWMTHESRVRWKVMGQSGKRILAYSLDPSWGYPSLRDALRAATDPDSDLRAFRREVARGRAALIPRPLIGR